MGPEPDSSMKPALRRKAPRTMDWEVHFLF